MTRAKSANRTTAGEGEVREGPRTRRVIISQKKRLALSCWPVCPNSEFFGPALIRLRCCV